MPVHVVPTKLHWKDTGGSKIKGDIVIYNIHTP